MFCYKDILTQSWYHIIVLYWPPAAVIDSTDVTVIEIEITIVTENSKLRFSCTPSNVLSIAALDSLCTRHSWALRLSAVSDGCSLLSWSGREMGIVVVYVRCCQRTQLCYRSRLILIRHWNKSLWRCHPECRKWITIGISKIELNWNRNFG